jgi:hypothetical protein
MPARAAAAATALRDGDDAVLERVGGVAGIVLDPEPAHAQLLGQVVGPDQFGVARIHVRGLRDVGRHRQQVGVPPDVGRTGLDPLLEGVAAQGELVGHLERPETLHTGVVRAEFDAVAALATGQRDGGTQIDAGRGGGGPGGGQHRGHDEAFLLIFPAEAGRKWHLLSIGPGHAVRR